MKLYQLNKKLTKLLFEVYSTTVPSMDQQPAITVLHETFCIELYFCLLIGLALYITRRSSVEGECTKWRVLGQCLSPSPTDKKETKKSGL